MVRIHLGALMNASKNIIVDAESTGIRLDVFLSDKLGVTRSQSQKMIRQKQIELNGKTPKKLGEQVKGGDAITTAKENAIKPAAKTVKQKAVEKEQVAKPQIIAETKDYIVVNKPSGLLTHPTEANEKNTLSGWLTKKYPGMKKVGDDPIRPGIVHRLDKEASGLLVVARTQKMFDHLKEQFKTRTINKQYLVLVHGRVAKDWNTINFPIMRSETADKMAAIPLTYRGQPQNLISGPRSTPLGEFGLRGKDASTEFEVEKRFINFTLLKVIIHTGRMHQIRAHMLAYNHPVVGDPIYFQKKIKRVWDEKCGRLFLHSAKLGFTNLEGEKVEFESPLPEVLQSFLKQLK